MTATPTVCAACGASAEGKFCSSCGASLAPRHCAGCRAELSPRARFCHRCGRPAGAAGRVPAGIAERERTAWIVAGVLCLLLIGLIVAKVIRGTSTPAAPEMANAGVTSAQGVGTPPDISRMSPRERFDRLFNRVMQAAEQGDAAQAARFAPMALAAYSQLDSLDADARYHAAVLRIQTGDRPGALALADTIQAQTPGHLFGYLIRGQAAQAARDSAALRNAARDFLSHYDAEIAIGRTEYREHGAALDEFRTRARQLER